MAEEIKIDISKHEFVPKHGLISEAEEKKLQEALGIDKFKLPKILKKDPAIRGLKVNLGNIIKITRDSKTAGTAIYYRVVV